MAARQLLIALDIGTTAIKVGLFAADGTLLRVAAREQALAFPAPGRVEQSPVATWRLLAEATREVMAGQDGREVIGLSLAQHRGTAIALDAGGNPLGDFVVWMDKRGVPALDWLVSVLDRETYYATSGHPVVSYTGISKLLWFERDAPAPLRDAAVLAPPGTLFLKWLGAPDLVADRAVSSFLFPFDIDRRTWSEALAARLGFPLAKLPRLVDATDVVGRLSADAAAQFGLPAGIPLVAGGGDGQCAGAGSGAIRPGRVMVNVGTGAGIQTFLPQPLRDPARTLNCAAHVVSGAWEMEGHTQSSGASLRWLRDTLGGAELAVERQSRLNAFDLLVAQAATSPPGARGLLFLPTFNGSSAPVVDLDARGALLGLSLAHERRDIVRALLEGISLELRWMLDALVDVGAPVEEVRLAGGGGSNPTWNQIHASILNRPVRTLRVADAAMVGAAMCAAVGVGAVADWDDAAERFVKLGDEICPLPEHRETYDRLYQNYRDAFLLLSRDGLFRRLGH